jgi:hypothetical protein
MAMHYRIFCARLSLQLCKSYALGVGELMTVWIYTQMLIGQVTSPIKRGFLAVLLYSIGVQSMVKQKTKGSNNVE